MKESRQLCTKASRWQKRDNMVNNEGTWMCLLLHCIITVAFGSWFDYTLDWDTAMQDNREYPVHTVSYEDLKRVSYFPKHHLNSFPNTYLLLLAYAICLIPQSLLFQALVNPLAHCHMFWIWMKLRVTRCAIRIQYGCICYSTALGIGHWTVECLFQSMKQRRSIA